LGLAELADESSLSINLVGSFVTQGVMKSDMAIPPEDESGQPDLRKL
jgi:hypothetical protein